MIDAMARLAGEDWTEDLDRDWRVVLDSIAGAMLAADESEQAAAEHRLAA
jgi:hypothetical protein